MHAGPGVGVVVGDPVGVDVGVAVGVVIGVAVGVAVGVEVGVGVPSTIVHTARRGLTKLLLFTAVTVGGAKVGIVSPPAIIATVPVGDT